MRVLDNLENYDIPSGFHLTAELEEQYAADLKEIVLALIPFRCSKLKTRQYFNSHLRHDRVRFERIFHIRNKRYDLLFFLGERY